jgi:hypothetical protein
MTLPRHYSTPGIPVTLFLSKDGRLLTAHLGEISLETLNDTIVRLQEGQRCSSRKSPSDQEPRRPTRTST